MASNKITSKLKNLTSKKIQEAVQKAANEAYAELEIAAQNAVETAKTIIINGSANPNFTQKHEATLADYITLKQSSVRGNFVIVAGENADEEIQHELYYAEYGAGQDATPSPTWNSYVPQGKINSEGYWFYPLMYPVERQKIKNGTPIGEPFLTAYGYTNTSVPLSYMAKSKLQFMEDVKAILKGQKFKAKLKTNIRRAMK